MCFNDRIKRYVKAPNVITQFYEMIHNQFGRKIKRFHSYNGTEFFNTEVQSYFMNNGIIHESSCVNTPQQNGLAERRLGYTLATARALLFQAHLPKKYWREAVLTTYYLINRIPSKVIDYESPLNRLRIVFPNMKLFSGLPGRIFGCVAFVHQSVGKLDPRAHRCIFVGYSSTQKGYRCYHPTTRKFLLSANVMFNESELYYKSEESHEMTSPERQSTDLEFLRIAKFILVQAPAMTLKDSMYNDPSLHASETVEEGA